MKQVSWCTVFVACLLILPCYVHAQADWPTVDCSKSRITTGAATKCGRGPDEPQGRCTYEHYAAYSNSDAGRSYVHLNAAASGGACFTRPSESITPERMKSSGGVPDQDSSNWSDVVTVAGVKGMWWFELKTRKCFAFFRKGPPETFGGSGMGKGIGVTYFMRGFYCGSIDGAAVTEAQIAAFLASISVR